jgi:hypothetical protein
MNKSKSLFSLSPEEIKTEQPRSFTTKPMIPLAIFTHLSPHDSKTKSSRPQTSMLRNLLLLITLFTLIGLMIDSLLASLVFHRHPQQQTSTTTIYPTLVSMPSTIYPGQISFLHLTHFAPNTRVFLSRDIAQSVRLDTSQPIIHVDARGNANVRLYIEDSWNVGMHYIQAEDINDHFTATTVLRIVGTWLIPPPHLKIQSPNTRHTITSIDMGTSPEGKDSLQSLLLHNSGGSVLSWSAHSDQPWLQFTPASGVFSNNERIYLAASRSYLKAGKYAGSITIQSNAGAAVHFSVHMQVQSENASQDANAVISPLVESFTATDGQSTASEQKLTLTNSGKQTLAWSLKNTTPAALLDQNMSFLATTDWLDAAPSQGMLAPGKTTIVHILVHSQHLLPSVYGDILQFSSGLYTQPIALSLAVLPRCGLDIDQTMLSFTAHTNNMQASQSLTAHRTANCSDNLRWGSYTPTSWLNTNSAHGILTGTHPLTVNTSLKSTTLSKGSYTGFIMLFTQHRSQTIIVTLNLLTTMQTPTPFIEQGSGSNPNQPANTGAHAQNGGHIDNTGNTFPTPDIPQTSTLSPSLVLSTLSMTFTMTQGVQSTSTQSISLENTGDSTMTWSASLLPATPCISIADTYGTLKADQAGSLSVTVNASNLPTGTYSETATIVAMDDNNLPILGGSQTITIAVTVVQPCTFSVAPDTIAFTSILLQPRSTQQAITVSSSGNCPYPLTWTAATDNNSPWLTLSQANGSDNGSGSTFTAHIDAHGILVGVYKTQIEVTATGSNGDALQNSPQTITVTITVLA